MIVEPGRECVLVSATPVSIHGATYHDVVVGDPDRPHDPAGRLGARLGPEAIEGDPRPGDRVRVEGFLRTITRIEKI